jgi:tetratricopeptide (TPR) repeat protein
MKFFSKTKAAFLYGKAIKSFLSGNFNNAITLFRRILELNPDDKNIIFTHYYLGRSYFARQRNIEAKEQMSIAYSLFIDSFNNKQRVKDVDYFKTLTKEYIQLLHRIGDKTTAERIRAEKNKIIKAIETLGT